MAPSVLAFQGGKRDPTPTPVPSTVVPSTKTPRRRIPVVRRSVPNNPKNDDSKNAKVAIKVTPTDSIVLLNDQQVSNSGSDGNLALTNLKPGSYVLSVRHAGYSDLVRHIDLKPDENDPINIALEPIKGTLSVKPNVDGSSIGLRSIDRDVSVGEYAGAIDQIEFLPGEYEVTISKPGYQPISRRVTLKPGATVDLEPRIDPLPAPTPTPTLQRVIATRPTVNVEGKYLVVSVIGTSGDTSVTTGTINVTVDRAIPGAHLQGSLNGLPCQVSLVSLENVAEGSLIESPSPSNGWAMVVIRVRPKDSKRAISFNINWSSIQRPPEPLRVSPINRDAFSPAVITYRARPEYPQTARSSRTNGVVTVSVLVDEEGKVKSAKAVDGPILLRQAAENAARQCRFKPATQNGVPTQSTETISFVFQLN